MSILSKGINGAQIKIKLLIYIFLDNFYTPLSRIRQNKAKYLPSHHDTFFPLFDDSCREKWALSDLLANQSTISIGEKIS